MLPTTGRLAPQLIFSIMSDATDAETEQSRAREMLSSTSCSKDPGPEEERPVNGPSYDDFATDHDS